MIKFIQEQQFLILVSKIPPTHLDGAFLKTMTETWNFESCNVYKQVVRVRNSHVCFMNWIIPSSRAIFVRRTTKIARELKTDKGSLQLKKKKPITRENIKYRDLKENIRTTHEKVKLQAGLSLITIMWLNSSTRCDQNYDFQNTTRSVRLRWKRNLNKHSKFEKTQTNSPTLA